MASPQKNLQFYLECRGILSLGLFYFLIFINDKEDSLTSAIRLFADDCLIYREIRTRDGQFALQDVPNKLFLWASTWGMEFNIKKCTVLTITHKEKHKLSFSYKMNNQVVEGIRSTKYLGLIISDNLHWTINNISGAANRMLGFLWRNLIQSHRNIKEKVYISFVRPKLEYCSIIWDPYYQKDIRKLEIVQNRAARFVTKLPSRTCWKPTVYHSKNQRTWLGYPSDETPKK